MIDPYNEPEPMFSDDEEDVSNSIDCSFDDGVFSDEDSSNEDTDGDEAEDSKGSDADEDDE